MAGHKFNKEQLEYRTQKKNELFNKMDTEGGWNVNYSQFAKESELPISTIHDWKREHIVKGTKIKIKPIGIEHIKSLQSAAEQSYLKGMYFLEREKIKEACACLNTYNKLLERLVSLLECFGYKSKLENAESEQKSITVVIHHPEKKAVETEKKENE